MTSGMGVKGTQGRCYGFFADFKECQAKVRDELKDIREDIFVKRILVSEMCDPHRVDYFECLHGFKENVRMSQVVDELEKQEYEAKHGPPPDAHH